MTTWNYSFDYSAWDRYFYNQRRADEAWVSVLMACAIGDLPSDLGPVLTAAYYAKKVLDEYKEHTHIYKGHTKIYPAG